MARTMSERIRMRCKFCGCDERKPCFLVAVKLPFIPLEPSLTRDHYILTTPGIALVPPDAKTFFIPCEWLLDDVCSNPECLAQAYTEAVAEWTQHFEEAV
jgi:hypothetical protein